MLHNDLKTSLTNIVHATRRELREEIHKLNQFSLTVQEMTDLLDYIDELENRVNTAMPK
jgi:adenine C2-methylase RlmN of 23S rRNA A2503 and tRNA A37